MKKKKICTLAVAAAIGISALGIGYSAWKTEIIGNGNVASQGKWDVKVTAADMEVSEGAVAALDYSSYQLNNECTSANISQVALQVANNKASTSSNVGKHASNKAMSSWVWLVDTTRFDMSKLGSLATETRRLLMLDGLENGYIIRLSDKNTAPDGTVIPAMKGWYGGNTYLAGTIVNIKTETAENIVDQLISESDAIIKQLRPDTYQDYALILCLSDGTTDQPENQFVIASMGSADGIEASPVSYTDTSVTYSNVTFGMPGAWAKYTLTVTNAGTVNANLEDITFELQTEEKDQLVLDAPDLEEEVLKPGEKCTLTFVIKVPEDYECNDLNATGTLNIKLPYSQDIVDPAPEAGHTHN